MALTVGMMDTVRKRRNHRGLVKCLISKTLLFANGGHKT
jgi:hypothetical protein